ncbi:MAG: tRNA (N(6)-L-threonylcarbamoyladenosine(37)-C(2))-methylthiotransferase MtaB [Candidatus Rokubacteria bacterium]|nr:tRNA (N(6)-L-threonylcarbamoyladenosine(37)-C(2))-methylthiotransferase MtaB [Candidatus Rokubacteria bacterium]
MTSEPVTVSVATLGCRLNQVESQEMLAVLESRGFRAVAGQEPARVYVVNTCTVTGRADFSDRQLIRRIARERPGALVVVTGCYAQTDPRAVARIPGVDLVVGNQEKYRLPELLAPLLSRGGGSRAEGRQPAEIEVAPIAAAHAVPVAPFARVAGRSRASVKVQDGCQYRCAFCIVPTARGGSRSQDPKVVLEQVRALVEAGYREITLTGVDLGHYGRDLLPRTTLAALVTQLDAVPRLRWLRLSSILPAYFTPELIEAIVGSRVVTPHLHLPLQSGSDRVLRLMRRPFNTRMYRALVERLARDIPGLGLGADMIVGHPGEGDLDFAETLSLVGELPFSYLHVFSYSDRKGTESARLRDHVPAPAIRARSAALRRLGRGKALAFRRRMLGRTHEALVLETRDRATGLLSGLTANYVEVLFDGPDTLARRFVPVTITDCRPEGTFGRLEEPTA